MTVKKQEYLFCSLLLSLAKWEMEFCILNEYQWAFLIHTHTHTERKSERVSERGGGESETYVDKRKGKWKILYINLLDVLLLRT